MEGPVKRRATIQNRDGRIQGTQIEAFLDGGIVVITGRVVVSRREGTLLADRVTVYYRTQRLVAEGATHMILRDLEVPP